MTVPLSEKFPSWGSPLKAEIQAMMRKVPLDLPCNEMLQAINFMKLQRNHNQTIKKGEKIDLTGITEKILTFQVQ